MAGPTIAVALRAPLDGAQVEDLDIWLHNVAETMEENAGAIGRLGTVDAWSLCIGDGAELGLPPPIPMDAGDRRCPVLAGIDDTRDAAGQLFWHDEAVVGAWIDQIGFFPDQELPLAAMCNRPINHRVLGHLALHLATRYDGILNLEGAWYPPMNPDRLAADELRSWRGKMAREPFVYTGPGHVYEVQYDIDASRRWYYNLVDVAAFAAMLQTPDFHLIE